MQHEKEIHQTGINKLPFVGTIVTTCPRELLNRWHNVGAVLDIDVFEVLASVHENDVYPAPRGKPILRPGRRRPVARRITGVCPHLGCNERSGRRCRAKEQLATIDHWKALLRFGRCRMFDSWWRRS